MQVCDLFTGAVRSTFEEGFNSKIFIRGMFRKILDWVLIVVSFAASFALMFLGRELHLDLSVLKWLGLGVTVGTFYKEIRSIFDNLHRAGVPIPRAIYNLLLLTEKEFDGILQVPTSSTGEGVLSLTKDLKSLEDKGYVQIQVSGDGQLQLNNTVPNKHT